MKTTSLLTLLILGNFYTASCMDASSLQDNAGNTPLHQAVLAWQKSNTASQAKAKEYSDLGEQCKQIKKLPNSPDKIAQHTALLEKAKIVKAEYQAYKREADSHFKKAKMLIEQGAYINTPNKNHKTVEQLCPDMLDDLVYHPLWQAIHAEDITTLRKFFSVGANPEFTNENDVTALQSSMIGLKPISAQELLFHGAQLNTPESVTGGNVLHLAAQYKKNSMISTLLESPQGSPVRRLQTNSRLQKCQQQMLAFLWCVNQKDSNLQELPLEIQQKIYGYVLPNANELINLVTLQELPKYKKYLGKKTLIAALTKRHMDLVGKALIKRDAQNLPPHMRARAEILFLGFIAIEPENETSKLLDPEEKPLEKRKETIKANYTKLLE